MKLLILTLVLLCLSGIFPDIAYAQFDRQPYSDEAVKKDGLAEIAIVGAGDIQLSLSEGQDIAASTGLGGTYWKIWSDAQGGVELQLEFTINVASTVDTIFANTTNNTITNNRSFGNYVLAPTAMGPATDISTVFYFKEPPIKFWDGIQLNAFVANQVWGYDSTFVDPNEEMGSVKKDIDATLIGWKVGGFYEFIGKTDRREKGISIRFGASYIGRSVQSDVGYQTGSAKYMRTKFLLNDKTTYHGLELSLTAKFGNIRAQASLPMMHLWADDPVPGLSGTQFVTTISFIGGYPSLLR